MAASSLFTSISRPQHLKLNNNLGLSSTLRNIRIGNSINIISPVYININNNKNVSLISKIENTDSKRCPIVYKDEKPGDNFPPPNGGGGGGGGGHGGEDDYEEKKFGAPMDLGILMLYLMESGSALGFLIRKFAKLRDRMLADPSFLFKVGTEIVIDSCCATFAEVRKRLKDFWDEFQLYAAVLLVGIVVDATLVGMLTPYARIGKPSVASGGLKKFVVLPICSFLKFDKPGCTFSTQLLHATLLYKGSLWALGFLTSFFAMLLDKMLPVLQFLFEAGIEIVIDSCCATFAEIQKRGKYLWDEFKSYAVDLLAGMLAPYARTGNRSVASGLNNSVAALPSRNLNNRSVASGLNNRSVASTKSYDGNDED